VSLQRANALPVGSRLDDYDIARVLGQGGFGITYLAQDRRLKIEVAIKEYLPAHYAERDPHSGAILPATDEAVETFRWGLERFATEAQTLARFKHSHIVRVLRMFEANNTAYMVMDYEPGQTLGDYHRIAAPLLDYDELLRIFLPVLDGLAAIHARAILHRDIKPDNIYLRLEGGPMLIDFGAARQAVTEAGTQLTALATPGYAPMEQYGGESQQGPWSDLYALGATMYRAIAGRPPPDAGVRANLVLNEDRDPLVPARTVGSGRYPEGLLAAIDEALALHARRRPQTAAAMLSALLGGDGGAPGGARPSTGAGRAAAAEAQAEAVSETDAVPEAGGAASEERTVILPATGGARLAAEAHVPMVGLGSGAQIPGTHASGALALPGTQDLGATAGGQRLFRDPLRGGGHGPLLVLLPAGSFLMGAEGGEGAATETDEGPAHAVAIPHPFALGRYPVTFAEYDRYAEATGTEPPDDLGWGRGDRPVINVSLLDALAYAHWLAEETGQRYRLPAEAEWEYAARAGTTGPYPWGQAFDSPPPRGGLTEGASAAERTVPVGGSPENPWGLCDLLGNVWQWTGSVYEARYQGAERQSLAAVPQMGKPRFTRRGGAWFEPPERHRVTARALQPPPMRNNITGFRVLREV
jgi:formylglycine-generating enzyme required for sulfatase activity